MGKGVEIDSIKLYLNMKDGDMDGRDGLDNG